MPNLSVFGSVNVGVTVCFFVKCLLKLKRSIKRELLFHSMCLLYISKLCAVFTWLGACSQEVHNVEMWSKMSHDLQFRHQGLLLTGACRGWKRRRHPWLSHIIKPTDQPCIQPSTSLSSEFAQSRSESVSSLLCRFFGIILSITFPTCQLFPRTKFSRYSTATLPSFTLFSTVVCHWFNLINSRFSIFTATFITGWERLSPYAVPSTTFPKAPEPRIRPERNTTEVQLSTKWNRRTCTNTGTQTHPCTSEASAFSSVTLSVAECPLVHWVKPNPQPANPCCQSHISS